MGTLFQGSDWFPLFCVGCGLAANLVVNFAILRLRTDASIFVAIRAGALVGLLIVVVALLLFDEKPSSAQNLDWYARNLCAVGIYSVFSYMFFGYVFLPDASVRLRILGELADNGVLRKREILAKYGAHSIIKYRLYRLLRSGQIVEKRDRFFTGRPRLLHVAKMFCSFKRLFLKGVVDPETHLHGE